MQREKDVDFLSKFNHDPIRVSTALKPIDGIVPSEDRYQHFVSTSRKFENNYIDNEKSQFTDSCFKKKKCVDKFIYLKYLF